MKTKEELARLSVVELRAALRDVPGAGVLRTMADRALCESILSGETKPTDWAMRPQADGSTTWVRVDAAPAPASERPEDPQDMLARALRALTSADLEERLAAMERRLAEQGALAARTLKIEDWTGATRTIDGVAHERLEELTRRVTRRGQRNVLLFGPAGSGKSTLAKQLADVLGVEYGFLSMSGDVTASHLIGLCPIRLTDGTVHHVPSPLTALWERPSVICLDEIDRADPGTTCALNAALAQGVVSIPQVNKTLTRHPQCIVVGCGNTPLQGSDGKYHAAQAQDAALADRFVASMLIGYDTSLERALARGLAGDDASIADAVCEKVWRWRAAATKTRFSVPITTRWILALVPAACDGVQADGWLRYVAPWITETDAMRLEGGAA